ncbi:MAG: protein kinase domain-containing protein [Terriglobales bacterium]
MKQCIVCNRSYPDSETICADDGSPLQAYSELEPGTLVRGKYKILSRIGAGGMATVYRAVHLAFQEQRAIKVVNARYGADPEFLKRFRTEAIVTRKLHHPNAVGIEDLDFMEDGRPFMVMELVDGSSLRKVIATEAPLQPLRAVRIAAQVAAALEAAHAIGITHRDIKPDNVALLQHEGGSDVVKVLDFGIAKVRAEVLASEHSSTTSAGMILGTPAYMSPEQAAADPHVVIDGRADIYSLGVMLFEMLTGQLLFQSESQLGMIYQQMNTRPQAPAAVNPALAAFPELCDLVLRCLEKKPQDRYASAAELSAALREVESTLPTAALDASVVLASAAAVGEMPSAPTGTTPQPSPSPKLEIAHVLFMDIVGYSKLPMDRQAEVLRVLQETVIATPQYRNAGRDELIVLPTGDGMALSFFGSPEEPANCAIAVATALRNSTEFKLRMGLHTGPVYRVRDIKGNSNVAGGGINHAQRVMDCGDGGHILASSAIADVLSQHSTWSSYLTDLGEVEVKHGLKLRMFNLQSGLAGNAELPVKLRQQASGNAPAAPPAATTGTDPASALTQELLDKTSRKLAGYIGPIATLVVKRASKKCSNAKELFLAVAGEIDSAPERERFLSGLREH